MSDESIPPQNLNEEEQEQAAKVAALRPHVIHEVVREEGEIELRRSFAALGWSGFAAGGSMGFSFLGMALLRATLPDEPWRHAIESFGYTLGFIIVILGRQQLYTESTLTAVLPVLTNPGWAAVSRTARLWAIVLSANLLGTGPFAALILPEPAFSPEIRAALLQISREGVSGSFGPDLLRAVLAGWMIALMVWLLPNAGSAKILVIALLTYIVSLGHFPHIVAGSADAIFAVFTGQVSFGAYLVHFLIPTLIGNTIGGTSLVALLNHAPVAGELKDA